MLLFAAMYGSPLPPASWRESTKNGRVQGLGPSAGKARREARSLLRRSAAEKLNAYNPTAFEPSCTIASNRLLHQLVDVMQCVTFKNID
eukprot:4483633-Amphidinium_carterae.1